MRARLAIWSRTSLNPRHMESDWVALVVIIHGDDGGASMAAGEHLGAADEWTLVFAKVVAAQELIEEEEHECAGGADAEAEGADRRDDVALPEVGEDAAA